MKTGTKIRLSVDGRRGETLDLSGDLSLLSELIRQVGALSPEIQKAGERAAAVGEVEKAEATDARAD